MPTEGPTDIEKYELEPKKKPTKLEDRTPEIAAARAQRNVELLIQAKRKLVTSLLEESDSAEALKHSGKRYVVFQFNNCMLKLIVSDGIPRVLPLDDKDFQRIFEQHAGEHTFIEHFFGSQVPDSIFYPDPFIVDQKDHIHRAISMRPFLIQDRVIDPATIAQALQTHIAEDPKFREEFKRFYEAYCKMETSSRTAPDIPDFTYPNVVVSPDSNIWIVDTNHLVPPNHYRRFGFDIHAESQRILRQLESGNLPENPQG